MDLILRPEYGYFVGWRVQKERNSTLFNPIWQPDLSKAVKTFNDYLSSHPTTDIYKELKVLRRRPYLKNKLEIVSVRYS